MLDFVVPVHFKHAGAFALTLMASSMQVHASNMNGWRTGGTGVAEGALPPIVGQPDTTIRWKSPIQSWGNASPVRLGSQICITEEPVSVTCFEANTGQQTWTATSRFMDTLPASERQNSATILDTLEQDRHRKAVLQSEMGRIQRELRRSGSGSNVQQRFDAMMAELNAIGARQEQYSPHVLSDEHGMIGYATPTPTVVDGNIYAIFGNGVLSKFGDDGERKWSVFLGPPLRPMLGYHTGNAASVLVADGVVLAPFEKLRGIDPSTGRVLWTGPEYPHYGTPAIATVDGKSIVVTPGGELIDPKTGAELGDPLAAIEFIGPVASDNHVYVIGHTRHPNQPPSAHATAYTLNASPDGRITATQEWERSLGKERIYATPLVTDERLYVLYLRGELNILNPKTGQTISKVGNLPKAAKASPSPVLGGDRLLLSFDTGPVKMFEDGDELQPIGHAELERHRSTLLLDSNRIYMRGFQYLYCIE